MANHTHGKIRIGAEDTGTFEALGSNEKLDVTALDSEPSVYGLDVTDQSQDALTRQNHRSHVLFVCLAILAVLAITRHLTGFPSIYHIRRLLHGNQTTQTQTAKPAQEQQAEQQPEEQEQEPEQEAPTEEAPADEDPSSDLSYIASTLSFNGTDLSIPQEELLVEASQGRIQVTHTPNDPVGDGTLLAGDAAMRAAALCNAIGGLEVVADGETEASPISQVTWIVRNPSGDAYLAVSYVPGSAPSAGSGIEVLSQSPSYRLSDSVYRSLSGVISQRTEAAPTLLDGEEVLPTAAITQ